MTPLDLSRLAREVEAALRGIRTRVVDAFRSPPDRGRLKDDGTVVTDLDVALEEELVERLLELDATFGLFSEERGEVRAGSPSWVLDPLDGSFNFSRRIPLFASQLALIDDGTPILAAIYEPLRDDLSWAARGTGAWREGRRLRVSDGPVEEAVVLVDFDDRGVFVDDPTLLVRLRRAVYRLRSLGSIGLHLRDVAAGTADGALGGRGRPQPLHDLAPGALLVREAGGVVTDLEGKDGLLERRTLAAGGAAVHRLLLALTGRAQSG